MNNNTNESGDTAPESYATLVPVADWFRIRWHHRRIGHPDIWGLRVRFDEMIARNNWDLAGSFDELIDRYEHLYLSSD